MASYYYRNKKSSYQHVSHHLANYNGATNECLLLCYIFKCPCLGQGKEIISVYSQTHRGHGLLNLGLIAYIVAHVQRWLWRHKWLDAKFTQSTNSSTHSITYKPANVTTQISWNDCLSFLYMTKNVRAFSKQCYTNDILMQALRY